MRLFILKHICGIVIYSLILYAGLYFVKLLSSIRRRGYYCDDVSIKKPFVKDTIAIVPLYMIGLAMPLTIITLNEFVQHKWIRCKTYPQLRGFCGYLCNLWAALMPFLYGFATERFLKSAAKFTVARLRPHFFTICQPVTLKGVACEDDFDFTLTQPFYVARYICSGSAKVTDSIFSSFPSGHSSLAFYGLVYTALYLQRFARNSQRHVGTYGPLVPVVQLCCLVLAGCVAVSRVFDYKHFWSDIFAGSLLGIIVAVSFSWYAEKYVKAIDRLLKQKQLEGVHLESLTAVEDGSRGTGCPLTVGDS